MTHPEIQARPIALSVAGMITALGGDVDSSCAAMRAKFNHYAETDFVDQDWHPIVGARAALDATLYGEARLIEMAQRALTNDGSNTLDARLCQSTPLLLCTPEPGRAGRADDDMALLARISARLGVNFHAHSSALAHGRVAGLMAIQVAQTLLYEHGHQQVLALAVDSLIDADVLAELDEAGRLLTPENPHGLIPGEAGVAIWLTRPSTQPVDAIFEGAAFATSEPAAKGARTLPIDGQELAAAITTACDNAGCSPADIGVRLADCNGSPALFEESSLAETRAFTAEDAPLPALWLPAETLGEVGAAYSLAAIVWACHAQRKGYWPGQRALVHASNDDGLRGAAVLQFQFRGK